MLEILEEHGFTEYEAQIYLCLLQNGQLNAYQVAEKTGLYHQACYDALNRMLERGRVTKIKEGKTQQYKTVNPNVLFEEFQSKLSRFKTLLPQLLTIEKANEDPIEVEVFKGKNVLKLYFNDVIRTLRKHGGTLYCTSVDEEYISQYDPIAIDRYRKQMLKHKLKEKVMVKEGTQGLFPSTMSMYRQIPEKYFNKFPVQIYGNTVQLLLVGTPMHMIIIRNQTIADSFRKQFEFMWAMARPYNKRSHPSPPRSRPRRGRAHGPSARTRRASPPS